MTRRIGVIGLGNVLMGDDGLGPYTVRTLESGYDLPSGVSVLDLGTPGPELADYLRDFAAIIVVDTLRADGPPGSVRTCRRPEIVSVPTSPRISPHEPGLREALLSTDLTGDGPQEVLLVGVNPEVLAQGTGLSPAVRAALPLVKRIVVDELARLGIAAKERIEPNAPDIWWERPTTPVPGSPRQPGTTRPAPRSPRSTTCAASRRPRTRHGSCAS